MSHNPFEQSAAQTKAIQSSVRQGGAPASALYEGIIKAAYLITNSYNDKQTDLALVIELPSGYEYKTRFGVLRDGSPEVLNTKTNKKELMFTYVNASHIVGAAIPGATLASIFPSVQKKSVNIYNFEKRADVLTEVSMITDLVGKSLLIGLQRKISNKQEKVGNDWVALPEKRETLEFGVAGNTTDRRTFTEFNEDAAAEDLDKWEKMNSGKDWDTYKEVGAASGVPASVTAAPAGAVHDFSAST